MYYQKNEEPLILPLPGLHCAVTEIKLRPHSDMHNTLVQTARWVARYLDSDVCLPGRCFFVTSAIAHRSLVILIEAPDMAETSVTLGRETVTVNAEQAAVFAEECALGDEKKTLRAFLRTRMPLPLFAMVNNWGDRNGPEGLNEAFSLREIDAAAALGLDVIQLDDGWQKGSSKDARIIGADGVNTFYRRFDGDFWTVDRKKYPNGLEPIAKYALSKGVTPGMWFAPDARNHFANLERDVQVLREAVQMGFRYFKLDMVKIADWEDRERFVEFLTKARALADDVSLQLDVTGKVPRLGFTDGLGYGKLFVENRYVTIGDYLPAQTLSNLWQLAQYIPAQHFQFEVPNRRKNPESYPAGDPLAPMNYSAAWQLASVMVSCPLFWMEVQHADAADCADVKPLLDVWKKERAAMAACDVIPVGAMPDGTQMTGFLCAGKDGGYLVALSEQTDETGLRVSLPKPIKNIVCLHANTAAQIAAGEHGLTVTLPDKAAYAFYRFDWAE